MQLRAGNCRKPQETAGVLVNGTNCSLEQVFDFNVGTRNGTAAGMHKWYMRMSRGFSESPLFVAVVLSHPLDSTTFYDAKILCLTHSLKRLALVNSQPESLRL